MLKPLHPLRHLRVGADKGRLVVYFHGTPGAPEEVKIFDKSARHRGLTIICFDRLSVDSSIKGNTYFQHLAKNIERVAGDREVDFIGFSIGAFIAIQTCRHMANRVRHLHLVSAAAPLDAGDFLDGMAGKQVFKLALNFPTLFLLLSYWQGLLARLHPLVLFRLIFASATGHDKFLVGNPTFRAGITEVLRSCFTGCVRGYVREVDAYVQPWNAVLPEIDVNTSIWHGGADNWSPPTMADYLQSTIPGCTSKIIFSGLSHYSCLYRSASEVCETSAID